jgi:hypothetical protein
LQWLLVFLVAVSSLVCLLSLKFRLLTGFMFELECLMQIVSTTLPQEFC